MTETQETTKLPDAQRLFLNEIELQLERFAAMRWLKAVPTKAPLEEPVVWGREIETPDMTLALSATRASLAEGAIIIRAVRKPGRPFRMEERTAVRSPALEATLKELVGFPPMTPSSRRPNQPLRRSGRQGMSRRRR